MDAKIEILEKVKFKNPILIEGLPGIGNVGKASISYMIQEMKMKKFAELYSPHFLPLVILHENAVANMLKIEFYYKKGKRDIIIVTGDTQSISPEGHYDICSKIIEFAKTLGVKDVITLGGFSEGKIIKEPRIIGAVNDEKLIKKYSKSGVDFKQEHTIGTIIGATGLLLGIARIYGIDGVCFLAETSGMLAADPMAAEKLLDVIKKLLEIKIDMSKLRETIKDVEHMMKKMEHAHSVVLKKMSDKEEIKYIG